MSHTIAYLGGALTCTSCGQVGQFTALCAPNARSEDNKLDVEKSKVDVEKSKGWITVFVAAMFLLTVVLQVKSGKEWLSSITEWLGTITEWLGTTTGWLGITGDKLVTAVDKTSDKIQQVSHVLSASIGGSLLASGKYSLFQLAARNLWSLVQNLPNHAQ